MHTNHQPTNVLAQSFVNWELTGKSISNRLLYVPLCEWLTPHYHHILINKTTVMRTKFQLSEQNSSYPDFVCEERVLDGRMTKARYKAIMHHVRKYNYDNRAPYGISANGYPYRCGCMHDCCGCLIGTSMDAQVSHSKTVLSRGFSFNY